MKNLLSVSLALIFFICYSTVQCDGQKFKSMNVLSSQQKNQNVDSLEQKILKWQKDLNIPNVGLGIIENGKIIKEKVFGNDAYGKPAPQNMLFHVASITKVVFTMLVLTLVDQGKWYLDEPLYHYYTDSDVATDYFSKKITTRHVLSQQSGFANWRWMNDSNKLAFEFEPGTKFNYSGEGMEYLRHAIENKFQKSLVQLSDSILFKPLHMFDTRHEWDGKKDFERFSRGFDVDGKEYIKTDYSLQASAAAGLITSVGDLCKFASSVMEGGHLSPALFKEMVQTHVQINPNLLQGLGWRVENDLPDGEYALEHGGNDPGVATLIVLLPKSKRAIIVLTNGDNGLLMCNNIVRTVWKEGMEIIHKANKSIKLSEMPKSIQLADNVLQSYKGNYIRPDGEKVIISSNDKGLLLKTAGIPLFNLLPETETKFFLIDIDCQIEFTKDNQGKVNGISIGFGNNNILKCKRVEN